MMTDISSQRRL